MTFIITSIEILALCMTLNANYISRFCCNILQYLILVLDIREQLSYRSTCFLEGDILIYRKLISSSSASGSSD